MCILLLLLPLVPRHEGAGTDPLAQVIQTVIVTEAHFKYEEPNSVPSVLFHVCNRPARRPAMRPTSDASQSTLTLTLNPAPNLTLALTHAGSDGSRGGGVCQRRPRRHPRAAPASGGKPAHLAAGHRQEFVPGVRYWAALHVIAEERVRVRSIVPSVACVGLPASSVSFKLNWLSTSTCNAQGLDEFEEVVDCPSQRRSAVISLTTDTMCEFCWSLRVRVLGRHD